MAKKLGVKRSEREVFLLELARHGSIRKACAVAGVTRRWLALQKQDNEFLEDYTFAIEDSVDRVEEMGNTLARSGDERMIRYLLDNKRYNKKTDTAIDTSVVPIVTVTIGGSA